jgi:hypothetical protein
MTREEFGDLMAEWETAGDPAEKLRLKQRILDEVYGPGSNSAANSRAINNEKG